MFKTIRFVWRDLQVSANRLCAARKDKNRFLVTLDMIFCSVFHLTLPSEYYSLGFDLIPRKARRTYLTEHKGSIASRTLNDAGSFSVLCNKYYASRVLAPFYRRECIQTAGLTFQEFSRFFRDNPKFVFKPISGYAGRGHVVYSAGGGRSPEDIYREIVSPDTPSRGVLESWIPQHEKLNELYARAVHTVRLNTIHDGSGENIRVFGANLSIGLSGEIVNTCLVSSVAAQVDNETGRVLTDGLQRDTDVVYTHVPSTGTPIRGFQLPDWDKALALVKQAAAAIPELRYIGWDVAFTPDGPVICEGNTNPGFGDSQNRAWLSYGCVEGLWPIIEPYLRRKKG